MTVTQPGILVLATADAMSSFGHPRCDCLIEGFGNFSSGTQGRLPRQTACRHLRPERRIRLTVESPMTYKSILLHPDIDGHVAPVIKLAVDLAKRFDARLIGLSAADVPLPLVSAEGMAFDGEIVARQRENIERRLDELREEFEGLAGAAVDIEWRGAVGNPTRLLIDSARAADLVVTGSHEGASVSNVHRSIDLGSLVLQAGRPMLVASTGVR
ncbi:universal stress protein [Mesorhizobium mediterraneum]|uniref:universal stress protein n=1 Tax=Mesorhizobium mediterraneum TaxID=43617 RepID=UPI00177B05C6|nr:universal stress protein [Mesorhizobium mediterraneum]